MASGNGGGKGPRRGQSPFQKMEDEDWVDQYQPGQRTEYIWEKLLAAHPGRLFVRANRLIEVETISPEDSLDEDATDPGVDTTAQRTRLVPVDETRLIGLMEEAGLGKREKLGKAGHRMERPGRDDRAAVRAAARHFAPQIRAVWPCPFLSPKKDAHIIEQPGYDRATKVFLAWDKGSIKLMPFDKAKRRLDKILADFVFEAPADKAHAVGLLLMPFMRPAINAPTPLHLITSLRAGSGKTYLASIVGAILGSEVSGGLSDWGSEVERQLSERLQRQPTYVNLDNIPADALAHPNPNFLRYLTSNGPIEERSLVTKTVAEIEIQCIWVATALRLPASEEMARRVVPIALKKNPNLKPRDLLKEIRDCRADVCSAFLSLLHFWAEAGSPVFEDRTLPSFERWAKFVGGVVGFIYPELEDQWLATDHRPKAESDDDFEQLAIHWTLMLSLQRQASEKADDSAPKGTFWPEFMSADEVLRRCGPKGLNLAFAADWRTAAAASRLLSTWAAEERQVTIKTAKIDGTFRFTKRRTRIGRVYGFVQLKDAQLDEPLPESDDDSEG